MCPAPFAFLNEPSVGPAGFEQDIAFYFADASAWKSADGLRWFQTGLVTVPQPSANSQAEACQK